MNRKIITIVVVILLITIVFYVISNLKHDNKESDINVNNYSNLDNNNIKSIDNINKKVTNNTLNGEKGENIEQNTLKNPSNNIYENSSYGFSFYYPNYFNYKKVTDGVETLTSQNNDTEDVKISIIKLGSDSYSNKYESPNGLPYTEKDIILDNKIKTKIYTAEDSNKSHIYISFSFTDNLLKNNHVIISGLCSTKDTNNKECSDEVKNTLDLVVSTLKFN